MWNMVTLSLKHNPSRSGIVLYLWFLLYCGKSTGLPYVYVLERIMRSMLESAVWWITLLHASLWGSIIMYISPQGQGGYLKRKLQCNVKNRPTLTSVSRMNKSLNKYFNGLKIHSNKINLLMRAQANYLDKGNIMVWGSDSNRNFRWLKKNPSRTLTSFHNIYGKFTHKIYPLCHNSWPAWIVF